MRTFLIYHGPICVHGVRNVETLCATKIAKELTLCLCSNGGDVTAGIGLFNYLRMLPNTINTHCFGVCGSIAATVFLAGKRRTSAPTSMFSLHAATYTDGPRKGTVAENNKLIARPFETLLSWQTDRLNAYFGSAEEKFLSSQTALEFGIVHEIAELSFATGDDILNVSIP